MSILTATALLLAYYAVAGAGILTIVCAFAGPEILEKAKRLVQEQLGEDLDEVDEKKGVGEMIPEYLLEKISNIVEEKTGVKLPRPKSIQEILAGMPPAERAKLQPILVPIVVGALREATGMEMDAALRLQEYLLGQSVLETELDVAIELRVTRMEKALAGYSRFKEVADRYRELLGDERAGIVNYIEARSTVQLLSEVYKDDVDVPAGLPTPQQVAVLALKTPRGDESDGHVYYGEVVNDGE